MQNFEGRVAVVTGGGSGIGRGLAITLAREGMHVAVADIEQAPAEAVAEELAALGVRSMAMRVDVSDSAQVQAFADRVFNRFGAVHVLCNNAGVVTFKSILDMQLADYQWVMGVNFFGLVHGLQAFLPRIVQQGGEAHIVNTSSIGGVIPSPGRPVAAYTASKYAIVGLSEMLRGEMEPLGIGVTVLCPGLVSTRLTEAGRNRQAAFGGPEAAPGHFRTDPNSSVNAGLDPLDVGQMVLSAMRSNQLYVLTGPDIEGRRQRIVDRFEEILHAYD